jgi:aconitate hydratase
VVLRREVGPVFIKEFDRVIEIDLSTLEPYINGPFTPDAATPISEFAAKVKANDYPRKMEVGLIGSCTNSSYQDISRAASIAKEAVALNLKVASPLIVNPGSEQIRATVERDGMIDTFKQVGAVIMANACGPCIGQWKRHTDDPTRKNSIVTSFNRNFAKRADGNPNTFAFVASPELTMALTIAGDLGFNPLTDTLVNEKGEAVKLSEPKGDELPLQGFAPGESGYLAPKGGHVQVAISPDSQRLQRLEPFSAWNGFISLCELIEYLVRFTVEGVDRSHQHVIGNVFEMPSESQPRTSHGNMISSTLTRSLDE